MSPVTRSQPTTGLHLTHRLRDALERLLERLRPLEPHLPLREGPGREVDVGVVETRQDAAPAEIDDVGARERTFVCADTAGDPFACERERSSRGHRRLQRADDAVLEDHWR